MSMWRQYIVLRDRNGRMARGFVKLFFTSRGCNISANLSRMPRGAFQLCLWDGKTLAFWPMYMRGMNLFLQAKATLENGRIEAAVIDANGRIAVLGESSEPRADWGQMQARVENAMQTDKKEEKSTPQEEKKAQPEPESILQEVSTQEEESCETEETEQPKTKQPFVLNGEASQTDCATRKNAAQIDWIVQGSMRREDEEKQTEMPLIEQLLQYAEPMEIEKEAKTQPSPEEIAKIIQKEMEKTEPDTKPIFIGQEDEQAEERAACIEQAVKEEKPAVAPKTPEEQEDGEPGKTQPEQVVLPEQALRDEDDLMEESFIQQEKANEPKREETVIPGPVLGGAYAGQWHWQRVETTGTGGYYLLGCVERQGVPIAMAVAVPGEYAPQPPAYLQGFSLYRDGYWVLAQDAETGRTLVI